MTTFAELKRQAETLPNRIQAAVVAGDVQALALLEQERATLPAAMFAAELRELQAELAEEREELAAAQQEGRDTRAKTERLQAELKEAQGRLAMHQRDAGQVMTRIADSREAIQRIRTRIEELAAAQAGYAATAAAPVMRNLVNRGIPGPVRWPS